MNNLETNHVKSDLLVRLIDGELTPVESDALQIHISACRDCRAKFQRFRELSDDVDCVLTGPSTVDGGQDRSALSERLAAQTHDRCALSERLAAQANDPVLPSKFLLRPFSWGLSLATAVVVITVLFLPQWFSLHTGKRVSTSESSLAAAIEIDGESFVRLPYSNPDLPMGSPRIVEMEVPVLSLADAGIVFEPLSQDPSSSDRSVRADVLLGVDGQPLGVHVLTAE